MLRQVHQRYMRFARRNSRAHWTVVVAPLAMLSLALLAACAGGSAANVPTPTARPAATATPALLYQADWSQGLASWNASPGWSIVNGAPQSDTGGNRSLTIPYQPSTPDYTVEFDLQILAIPQDGGYYSLNVAPTASLSGYRAGVYSLRAPGESRPNGDHPTIFTNIEPADAMDPSTIANTVKDFEPGDGTRTYRVEISGNAALLYADGRFFTSAQSTASPHLAPGPLVLVCGGVAVRITGVRVYSAP